MEKSQERERQDQFVSLESLDTRPIKPKTDGKAGTLDLHVEGKVQAEAETSFRDWLALLAYWFREYLWRRRFWYNMRDNSESELESRKSQ